MFLAIDLMLSVQLAIAFEAQPSIYLVVLMGLLTMCENVKEWLWQATAVENYARCSVDEHLKSLFRVLFDRSIVNHMQCGKFLSFCFNFVLLAAMFLSIIVWILAVVHVCLQRSRVILLRHRVIPQAGGVRFGYSGQEADCEGTQRRAGGLLSYQQVFLSLFSFFLLNCVCSVRSAEYRSCRIW